MMFNIRFDNYITGAQQIEGLIFMSRRLLFRNKERTSFRGVANEVLFFVEQLNETR